METIYKIEEIHRVNVSTLTLGFSRFNVPEIVLDTKYETISSFLAGSFETIRVVPKELVIDNIKYLVDKPRTKDTEDILNIKFEEFLKYYGINYKPCMSYRSEKKIKIINDEDNKNISPTTNMPRISLSRIVLLNKEKDDLSLLPARRIPEKYHLYLNSINGTKDSFISYKSNKYSVTKRLIWYKVNLIVKNNKLHIYYNNKIVTIHQISKSKLNIKECHNLHYTKNETKDYKDTNFKEIMIVEMWNIIYD